MLPVKNIYIDSRFKSSDSESDSNMKIDLKTTLNLPDDCICFLDDITIPVSFYNIDQYRNIFYFNINNSYYYETIESNNYSTSTLSYMISDILNGIVNKFKVVTDIAKNIIKISTTDNNLTFKILTDTEATEVYPSPLNSINEILMNNNPKLCSISSNYVSGYINLSTIRNIYIYIYIYQALI